MRWDFLRRAFRRVGIGVGSRSGATPPFEPGHQPGLIAWYRASDTVAGDQPCLVDGNMEEVSCVSQPALLDGDMETAPPASPTIVDADMEAAGVDSWTNAGGCGNRAKSSATPHSGSQCLTLTDDGVNNYSWVYQVVLTAGHTYRLRGWARGDGAATPRVHDSAAYIWVGTTSSSWQEVDVTFVAGGTQLRLYATGLVVGSGNHAEFDDLTIEDLTATAWTTGSGVVSKQTGTPYAGTYCLRVAGASAYAYPATANTTIGQTYRIRGRARGDGSTGSPRIVNASLAAVWTGTTSADWQEVDVTFVATGTRNPLLFNATGGYSEFDAFTIENVSAGAWSAANAVLSKRNENPHSGSRCLRVAYDGSHAAGSAYQTIVSGAMYRARGWARGDGTSSPIVIWSGAPDWSGTTSTEWQYFDAYAVAGSIYFQIESTNLSAGHWVEFDDVSIERVYLADGDCEASGIGYWSVSAGAAVTKETTDPHSGTQCIRIACDASAFKYAYQSVLTVGKVYRLRGYGRGLAVGPVIVMNDGTNVWTGTASLTWQYFDVTFKATNAVLDLFATQSATGYVEFDDLVLEPAYVVDGDMEGADCSAWAAYQAVLSKEGSAGSRVLRVSYDGVNAAGLAYQSHLTTGQCYRVRGRARGDGVCAPSVLIGYAVENWSGTPSTDWQDIDVCGVALGDNILRLQCNNLSSGSHVEYSDITVECVSASAFTDLSGHTRNCNQATLTKQFGVIPDQLNGYPVARFDGVDDLAQALFPLGQPITAVVVAKWTVTAGARFLTDGGTGSSVALVKQSGTTDTNVYAGSYGPSVAIQDGAWAVYHYTANGASSAISVDGGSLATGNAGTNAANGVTLGAQAGELYHASAELAEAFFYAGVLDAETLRRAVDYCQRKYDL